MKRLILILMLVIPTVSWAATAVTPVQHYPRLRITVTPERHAVLRWQALSMIESADRDGRPGPNGEVSRWQIAPQYWYTNTRWSIQYSKDPVRALVVCKREQAKRVAAFTKHHKRPPTDGEWFLIWHAPPGHVLRPDAEERDYRDRCLNLLDKPTVQ